MSLQEPVIYIRGISHNPTQTEASLCEINTQVFKLLPVVHTQWTNLINGWRDIVNAGAWGVTKWQMLWETIRYGVHSQQIPLNTLPRSNDAASKTHINILLKTLSIKYNLSFSPPKAPEKKQATTYNKALRQPIDKHLNPQTPAPHLLWPRTWNQDKKHYAAIWFCLSSWVRLGSRKPYPGIRSDPLENEMLGPAAYR